MMAVSAVEGERGGGRVLTSSLVHTSLRRRTQHRKDPAPVFGSVHDMQQPVA